MKITSCGGQVVTYKGKIDMKVSFQVFWNEEKKRVNVKIRPVDTELSDVNVLGCRPPWYLWWVFLIAPGNEMMARKFWKVDIENIRKQKSPDLVLCLQRFIPRHNFESNFYGNADTKEK